MRPTFTYYLVNQLVILHLSHYLPRQKLSGWPR